MSRAGSKSKTYRRHGLGWRKDSPEGDRDVRQHDSWQDVKLLISQYGYRRSDSTDFRRSFPEVRDQGGVDSSTAFACLAVVEYFEHRVLGAICERSKAFLHSLTHSDLRGRALGSIGRGCSIRESLETLIRYGSPPEIYLPYSSANCRKVPKERLLFSFAGDFQGLRYARLDQPDSTGKRVLRRIKKCLAAGIPVVFGFEVHHSTSASDPFPLREPFYALGWQSVVACGYDDRKSALLIRNSWGSEWGEAGYDWLPYDYVTQNHAADFWVLFKNDWIEGISAGNA
jgi:hypothetical protein